MTGRRDVDAGAVLAGVERVAAGFAADRRERQRRTALDPADFDALADAGFLLTGVPASRGGLFDRPETSTRALTGILRALGRGDSSVALVASMHPAVLAFWLASPAAPEPHTAAWAGQRDEVTALAAGGAWWGTITSEPGSGGDVARTRTAASPDGDDRWLLTGAKHFGSGTGIAGYMITTALPDGEDEPDWFYFDARGLPGDGDGTAQLVAEWDGHGMAATQSHAIGFEAHPATRVAWPSNLQGLSFAAGGIIGCLFAGVIAGVVDAAMAEARTVLTPRKDSLRPFEQVEWAEAVNEKWLLDQAVEGMVRAVEQRPLPLVDVIRGKTAAARLAESITARLCRVVGGGSFSRTSPFGHWFEDVRALGFLRPPWGLAYDLLIASSELE